MADQEQNARAAAVEESVAAFDAANLVWGQFYRNTWSRLPENERERAQPVREALGEAAISVPQTGTEHEIRDFAAALDAARRRLLLFIDALEPGRIPGDVREVPEALREAAEYLQPYLRHERR